MRIQRASHLGMCFGVRDAIQLATRTARQQPLTILGQLVHNESVVRRLRADGVRIADTPAAVATPTVMVTAHGASDRAINALRARGLDVLEATCPLVKLAHLAVRHLVRDGYHPVIIGQREHVEVRGLTGDLDAFDVVLDDADIERLIERPRIGVAAQTTQPADRVQRLTRLIRQRFPGSEVKLVDTVCRPTKDRQSAAVELARSSDVVVVVGGAASNNTRELVARCSQHCSRVHHVQTADDLCREWFHATDRVGITAGTSTPDAVIEAVEQRLRELADRIEDRRQVTDRVLHQQEALVSVASR